MKTSSDQPASSEAENDGQPGVLVVTIRDDQRQEAEKRIGKMLKKAAVCGAWFTYTFENDRVKRMPPRYPLDSHRFVRLVDLVVTGDLAPRIAGHRFVGVVDHAAVPGATIVRDVPGHSVPAHSVPAHMHGQAAYCDHCAVQRRRNLTIVMQRDEDGEYRRFGRACCKHYFGHDVGAHLAWLTCLTEMEHWDDEEGPLGGRFVPSYLARDVLLYAASLGRVEGFVGRAASERGEGRATADQVWLLVERPSFAGRNAEQARREYERWKASVTPTQDDETTVDAAIAWLADQRADGSSYLHNLQAISTVPTLQRALFGYWVSLISSYQRATGREKARALSAGQVELDEHLGQVRERREMQVVVSRMVDLPSRFGRKVLVSMRDVDGRPLVWFATGDVESLKVGEPVTIKATVKEHGQYRGRCQTVLSRAVVLQG